MKKLQIRKWKILVCGIFLFFITGYAVSAKVWISRDNSIQTGGDVYRTGELTDREMNVFGNAATVSGKDAVIAPGSKGCYTFTIQNTKDFPMEVRWQLSDENLHRIPMQYRLKIESDYLYGSAQEWIQGENLEKYLIEDQLSPGEQREYALDWEWPFSKDEKQDQRDTELGNLAASGQNVNYQLCLSIRAEGDGDDSNGDLEHPEDNKPSEPEMNGDSNSEEQTGTGKPEIGNQGGKDQTGNQESALGEQSGVNGTANGFEDGDKYSAENQNSSETSNTEQQAGTEQYATEENGEIFNKGSEDGQQKIEVSTLQAKKGKSYVWWWILLLLVIGIIVFTIRRWKKRS